MALEVGQCHSDPVTGLAGLMFTYWTGAGDSGMSDPLSEGQRNGLAAMLEGIALAIVEHLQSNAEVTGTDTVTSAPITGTIL